jgi:hypothetical protein
MKIFGFFLLIIIFHTTSYACCCVPSVSCAKVEISMEKAKTENKEDVNTEDDEIGEAWLEKVQKELNELSELKRVSLEKQKHITNLEYATLIESFKEEMNYTTILEYKKTSFDEKNLNAKLNILENNINIQLNALNISNNYDEILIKR